MGQMCFFQGIILKGWIDLTSGKDSYAKKSGKYFDEALKEKINIFALMGKVRAINNFYKKEIKRLI